MLVRVGVGDANVALRSAHVIVSVAFTRQYHFSNSRQSAYIHYAKGVVRHAHAGRACDSDDEMPHGSSGTDLWIVEKVAKNGTGNCRGQGDAPCTCVAQREGRIFGHLSPSHTMQLSIGG